jgi:hypothetical protein
LRQRDRFGAQTQNRHHHDQDGKCQSLSHAAAPFLRSVWNWARN